MFNLIMNRWCKDFWVRRWRYILLNNHEIFIRFIWRSRRKYVSSLHFSLRNNFPKWSERIFCDSRDTDEEFFYRGEVMILALCQVWVNDVTAGGITCVTKSREEWRGSRAPRSVTPSIRKVEDRIVYVRDKRVGLSIINQFASTRQQLGNYISPFYRELWNHSSYGSRRSRVRTGPRKWTAPQF